MTDTTLSKLRLEFKHVAEASGKPNLEGDYSHAGETTKIHIGLWAGVKADTALAYARGKLTFPNVTASVEANAAAKAAPLDLPAGVDIRNVGEVVLFKDTKATGKNGAAHWYGYANEGKQIVRIDAYEHGNVLLGGVKPWRPKAQNTAPAGDAPEVA